LQELCADVTGNEAELYAATGTIANEIAMHVFVRSGHLAVCEATAHVAGVEVTSAASLSGIAFAPVSAPRGQLTANVVAEALRPDPYDVDMVDLVSIENTHQVGGGTVMPVEEMRAIRKVAGDSGVPVYLDGARIFNAAAATGLAVSEYTAEADAMMFSLSKGLGAPIGSVLCGSAAFVREARRVRILFGGGWRQAGIVAAAGIVALRDGPQRLVEDHVNARRLADGIAELTPAAVDPLGVETNIVFADAAKIGLTPLEARDRLGEEGVLATIVAGKVRMVTHRDVSSADIEGAIAAWGRVAQGARGPEGR